jgi:non-ribosomal peptide synthetase component F
MFVLQNIPQGLRGWELPGLEVEPFDADDTAAARFDLSISLAERRDEHGTPAGIGGYFQFAVDLFDASTVRALVDRVVRVLDQVGVDPQVRLSGLDMLAPAEWDSVVEGWNDTAREVPALTVAELFAGQVGRAPDAVAVVGGGLLGVVWGWRTGLVFRWIVRWM